jgi:hypothetical protein
MTDFPTWVLLDGSDPNDVNLEAEEVSEYEPGTS